LPKCYNKKTDSGGKANQSVHCWINLVSSLAPLVNS